MNNKTTSNSTLSPTTTPTKKPTSKATNTKPNRFGPALQHCLRIVLGAATGLALSTQATIADTQVRITSENHTAAFSEGYALSVEDWNAQTRAFRSDLSGAFHHQSQERSQVWISDIGTLLFDDNDGDGYHAGFSLTLDVDSEYGDTEVYASIYLEPQNSPTILLHTTGRFSVYGSTIGDEYRVDTELRNSFASDDYNVIIDIHDAWSDRLLDTANARGFSNLSQLPLESADLDYGSEADHTAEQNQGSADVVVTEYAGLFHPALLLLLAGLACFRRYQVSK